MASSGITFSGLSSGIDSAKIIDQLMAIEQRPIDTLKAQQTKLNTKLQAMNSFHSQLSAFRTVANNLTNASTFTPSQATSSDQTVATATSTQSANEGTFQLTVTRLAQAHKVASASQTSATAALGQAGTFTINSKSVEIVSGDSLTTMAQKINAAQAGVKATVLDGGSGSAYLTITANSSGVSNAITVSDTTGTVLNDLGIWNGSAFGSELVEAKNAAYTLDGISMTSASNTLDSVIPGVTLTLKKGNETTPETSTITVTRNDDQIKSALQGFGEAFNLVIGFIKTNTSLNADTYATGPLFGNLTVQNVENSMTSMVFQNVNNISTSFKNLADIGFGFDDKGMLTLDTTRLDAALQQDAAGVANLFKTVGESSNPQMSFIIATTSTSESTSAGYDVTVTQAATQGSYLAETAQTSASTGSEVLTFDGALFGYTPFAFQIPTGSTLTDTISLINSDTKLKKLLSATNEGGKLKLQSLKYGVGGNFSVGSNLIAASDNSGIGSGLLGTLVEGVDIAGTINGQAAVGNGQFLIAQSATSFKEADGLQIMYTGTATGSIGTIKVSKGIGTRLYDSMNSMLDIGSGLVTTSEQTLQNQYDTISDRITTLTDQLATKRTELQTQFTNMEDKISQLNAQAQQLSALYPTNSSTNK